MIIELKWLKFLISNDFVGLVPARSGSKSVKNKNMVEINGRSLIARTVQAGLSAGLRDVYISTNEENYALEAQKFGAHYQFLRPENISGDNATDEQYLKHFAEFCEIKSLKYKYVVLLRPTTPFRMTKILKDALDAMINLNHDISSMRSAHTCTESPFKWFLKDEFGLFKPLDGKSTTSDINRPRQHFENVYIPNGYIDILKIQNIKNNIFWGDKMFVFETPLTYEIDSVDDLNLCRLVAKNLGEAE